MGMGRGYEALPKILSLMAMPASSARMTPVVIMRTGRLHGGAAHQADAVDERAEIADVERGLVAVETDIGERAFGNRLSIPRRPAGARQASASMRAFGGSSAACWERARSKHAVPMVDDGRDMQILVRVHAANDGASLWFILAGHVRSQVR